MLDIKSRLLLTRLAGDTQGHVLHYSTERQHPFDFMSQVMRTILWEENHLSYQDLGVRGIPGKA